MGGKGHDEANDVIALKDGYILVGYNSSISRTGVKDAWIIKNDYNHNMQWQRYWNGIKDDGLYSIVDNQDGTYLVGGFANSKGSGDKDILLLLVDKDGKIIKEAIYGGVEFDQIKQIQKLDDGYMLVGTSRSYTYGADDGIVLKIDKSLNKLYLHHYGDRKDDNLIAISKLDSGFVAVGHTKNKTAGSSDGWVLRLDKDANLIKEYRVGGAKFEFFTSVVANSDGGYTIVGYSGTDSDGLSDIIVLRYDKDDNQLWKSTLGGDKFEKSKKIISDGEGGYLVVGATKSLGAIRDDGYLARVDKNGKLLWQKRYGKDGKDLLYSATLLDDGNFLVSGEYGSDDTSEGDMWAIIVDKDGNIIKK
jgi:hypothetical protein